MKLDVKKSVVEAGNLGDTSSFSMEMNAKAFKMLTGTLYNDKIGSIVRELSCNAVDAHRMNGNENEPFVIHLPDAFEPYLSFQDFGVGMSDSDIRETYVTLFKSTKDNSNDAVGAFGLGSKTPLSYTDNFNVTAIYNGVVRDYLVFIDDSGVPAITKVGERETTERNGVTVQVGIEQSDFHEVTKAVKTQLQFFDVKPKIVNGSIAWNEFKDRTDWGDLGFTYRCSHWDRKVHFVQGGVGYELDLYTVRNWLNSDDGVDVFSILCDNNSLVMYFDIGDFGVTVSREDIEIDNKVKENFRVKFNAFVKIARNRAKKILDDSLKDLSNFEFIQQKFGSPEAKLCGLTHATDFLEYMGSPKYFKVGSYNTIDVTHPDLYDADSKMNFMVERYNLKTHRSVKITSGGVLNEFSINTNIDKYYFVDDAVRYIMKANYEFDKNSMSSIYLVKSPDGGTVSDSQMQDFERIITDIFEFDIEFNKISDIELPKNVTQRRKYATAKYRHCELGCYSTVHPRDWDKGNDLLDDVGGGVYIPVFNLEPLDGSRSYLELLNTLYNERLVKNVRLYAFNEKLSAKVENDPDWICITDYVETILRKAKLNTYLAKVYRANVSKHIDAYNHDDATRVAIKHADGFENLKEMMRLRERDFGKLYDTRNDKICYHFLDSTLGHGLKDALNHNACEYVGNRFTDDFKEFNTKFALLPLLNYRIKSKYSSDDNFSKAEQEAIEKHIIQYVNCVK